MTIVAFSAGVNTSFSSELNSNSGSILASANQAMIEGTRALQASGASGDIGVINNQIRDLFSDSTGFYNTINTSNTTATHGSVSYYATASTSAAESRTVGAGVNNGAVNATLTCINSGYISSIEYNGSSGSTVMTIEQDGIIIATKTFNPASGTPVTFSLSDYRRIIRPGTFSIKTSGTGIAKTADETYSGTNFSYTSQQVPSLGTPATGQIDFIPTTLSAGIIETNAQFSSGDNINKILLTCRKADNGTDSITYDVSVDNGSTYTTGLSLDTINSITSTAGNQLIIKINIPADEQTYVSGYGLIVGR